MVLGWYFTKYLTLKSWFSWNSILVQLALILIIAISDFWYVLVQEGLVLLHAVHVLYWYLPVSEHLTGVRK